MSNEEIFNQFYKKNFWGSIESRSGPGSELIQTQIIRKEIPKILYELKIFSILDIPCGDFNWFQHMDMDKISYLGADIVDDVVNSNIKNFETPSRKFTKLDISYSLLPKVDLILCRDALVHFSYNDIKKSMKNFISSNSKYLLTTSFLNMENNVDITTGEWRKLNLLKPPFSFPEPIKIIYEDSKDENSVGKALCLWKINDLKFSSM